MIDLDIRAIQVKRMTEAALATMHRLEDYKGFRLMPWEIERNAREDLKTFYGVPAKGSARRRALRQWGDTIRQVLGRFMRERQLHPSLDDLESLHAFDRAVWSSDLDFHYRTATPAKKARGWYEP